MRPSEDVVHQRLEDEVVLVHLTTNRIYALNETGARLWELLAEGHTREEARNRLLEEFDVPPAVLDEEVERLLSSLVEERLIVPGE